VTNHRRVLTLITGAATAVVLAVSASPASGAAGPGAPGIGDPYYPNYGNGGYDVAHYDLKVRYQPDTDDLTGVATIHAKATQDLSRFNLDLIGLTVREITVNGKDATWTRQSTQELVITPKKSIKKGGDIEAVVRYDGRPTETVEPPGVTFDPWFKTPDGVMAVGEPEIAAWWFPSNDHPRDKATYDMAVTVPSGTEAIANGKMRGTSSGGGLTTWKWRENRPMMTYLAFMAIGQFDISTGVTDSGIPFLNGVSTRLAQPARGFAEASIAKTPEILDFEAQTYGAYPFTTTGNVITADEFGFALENQSRPTYDWRFFRNRPNEFVVVHEQAHQWFGDSVGVENWRDIWLNEGFATYTEWLWSEHTGQGTAQEIFDATYAGIPADDPFWTVIIGDPGVEFLFDGAVYDRGAMTLHALRTEIGDPAFFTVMRKWYKQHKNGNGSVQQFMALAERESGQDLGALFQAWLFTGTKPAATSSTGVATSAATASRTGDVKAPKSFSKIREASTHRAPK
jgi:aminopeptidase N